MQAGMNEGAIHKVARHRLGFSFVFVTMFFLSVAALGALDLLPEVSRQGTQTAAHGAAVTPGKSEQPVRVVAQSIGLDVSVANPASTDVDVLDQYLLKGAVRYPTSANLGVDGTVLLFGHSSYLPVVHNQAYKTFDGVQDLKTGDVVSVFSVGTEYQYKVVGVRVANAVDEKIDLSQPGKHLVLVTCDSFATKSDRFVVTADFVGAYSFTSN